MKDYTFANGITVPKGSRLRSPLGPLQFNNNVYENADEFDGFRFSRLREQHGDNAKYFAVNTSIDYLNFGHGQNAWYSQFVLSDGSPGRFFAVNEIKMMLAWTIMNYDFKTEDGKRPADKHLQFINFPDPKAEILIKRKSDLLS